MADYNVGTLGYLVQQFTEEDLQRSIPIIMQDVSAENVALVEQYETLMAQKDYAGADALVNANPSLYECIWNAAKANALLAYSAHAYQYAKNAKQQCVISETEPVKGTADNEYNGQNPGDIWYKIETIEGDLVNTTPYQLQEDGTYREFTVAPKLNYATEDDINEIIAGHEVTNENALINVGQLATYNDEVVSGIKEDMDELSNTIKEDVNKSIQDMQSDLDSRQNISMVLSGTTLNITIR